MRAIRTIELLALAVVILSPIVAEAQSATTGAIAGVARDTTGAVLPGVTVEAASPALIERTRVVATDEQGNYKIVDLRPGTYAVTFTLPGFAPYKREGIELTTGFTASANAEMKVGSLEETVTVTGASPVVDVQNVRTQNVLSRDVLDTVPSFRTIQGYSTLTLGATVVSTGVSAQDVGGNKGEVAASIAIHGAHATDLKLLQDGMPFNSVHGGGGGSGRWFFVNQAGTQEVTLQTGGMSAESQTGGIQLNVVPKEGGNSYKLYFNGSYTNHGLQSDNLSAALRSSGLTNTSSVKEVYDWGAGLGGPIMKDKLWFYTAHRWWGSQEYAPGNYYNKTQGQYLGAPGSGVVTYTPDVSRPAYNDFHQRDNSLRLTWQVSRKDRLTISDNLQSSCNCFYLVDQNRAPEATPSFVYWPINLTQTTWSHPATNRLLFESGLSILYPILNIPLPTETTAVSKDDIGIQELSTGYRYGSVAENLLSAVSYGDHGILSLNINGRVSTSYVTGSHAFKTGLFVQTGRYELNTMINRDVSYAFRFGAPVSLTEWASPHESVNNLKLNLGLYSQDQWTLKRLTLNLGLRLDYLNAYAPAQHRPGGQFVGAFDFSPVYDAPNWKDVSPRLGAAYDLFGNSKTAVKVSLGRYMVGHTTDIAQAINPTQALVVSATRTWTDANGNYVPDCNLQNSATNGECGPLNNSKFGTVNVVTHYAPDVLSGFGARDYDWQTSASLQHEFRPGLALNVGYFRTWYGNFTVTQNQSVSATDYSPYCVTAPADLRLPGGGGNQICGLYDVSPTRFGQVSNLITQASNFGTQTEIFNGVDLGMNVRVGKGGLLQGGVATSRTVTDNCFQNSSPNLLASGAVATSPRVSAFCHVSPPWSVGTQVKAQAVYPLPLGFQTSATFQNLPGIPIAASYVATNTQIAPSLGRNLAAGANGTATIDLIPANTMFENRLTQLDLRITKSLRIGHARVLGNFDIYNLFNANTILGLRAAYGPTWLQPTQVLGGRLVKFGAQFDF